MAIQDDPHIYVRLSRIHQKEEHEKEKICKELFWSDIFDKVQIPDNPPPNMKDPVVFQ